MKPEYRNNQTHSTNINGRIVLRMAAFCTFAGLSLGGFFGFLLGSLAYPAGIIVVSLFGALIGAVLGGSFGLVFGIIGGIVLAHATSVESITARNRYDYVRQMQNLSQSVALIGLLAVCFLSSLLTIPAHGWQAWAIGALILGIVPGVIAIFAFRWASRQVTNWVLYQQSV